MEITLMNFKLDQRKGAANCVKVAQKYALEKQIEVLNLFSRYELVKITQEGHAVEPVFVKIKRLEEELKAL
jgi:hypothetical protein